MRQEQHDINLLIVKDFTKNLSLLVNVLKTMQPNSILVIL